jgi:hypothetical protein
LNIMSESPRKDSVCCSFEYVKRHNDSVLKEFAVLLSGFSKAIKDYMQHE